MALKLITAAAALAVTLAEVKDHLRVTEAADDLLITAMITAATETAEQNMGRAIMPQLWEYSDDDFDDEIKLTRVPVVAVTSFTYIDLGGVTQTIASDAYILDNADDFSVAKVTPVPYTYWPIALDQPNAVKVRFTAGYTNATAVPEPIKAWIKLQVGAMYENRESEAAGQTHALGFADRLLDRYKVYA